MISLQTYITVISALLCTANCFAPGLVVSSRISFQTRTGTPSFTKLPAVKKNMTKEEKSVAMEKAMKAMTSFSNTYLKNTCTKLCVDKSIPAVVIKGLAEHKVTLGAPLCPCRFYDDKEKEVKDGYWNCPCVPMRERHECHCMLFLTEDNDFAGKETVRIDLFASFLLTNLTSNSKHTVFFRSF